MEWVNMNDRGWRRIINRHIEVLEDEGEDAAQRRQTSDAGMTYKKVKIINQK
jgi:hypothetical protein